MSEAGNSILDAALTQFSNREVREIPFPEWGDDLVFYVSPMTVSEADQVNKATKRGGEFEGMLTAITLKCCDADGQRLFGTGDKAKLRKLDSGQVVRLAGKVMHSLSFEDMEGN